MVVEVSLWIVNAESARLAGLELEFRRPLSVVSESLRHWAVNANYSYITSDVTIGEHNHSRLTNTEHPMAGQSDHVGNFALQFYQPEWGTMARLLYNYASERITDVGALGAPDVYENPYSSLDLVFSQQLNFIIDGLSVKLKGTNLTDQERKFTQGGLIQRAYKPGTSYGLSMSYSIQ